LPQDSRETDVTLFANFNVVMLVVAFRDAFHADISNREFAATLRDLTGDSSGRILTGP